MPFCWPAAEAAGGRPWTVMLASSYTYPCLYLRVCVRVCYYSWYIDVLCTNYFASAKLLASFPNCGSGFPLAPPALNPSAVALSFPGWYEIMIHVIAWCLNCYLINLITYCTYCLAPTQTHTHTGTHTRRHLLSTCGLCVCCWFRVGFCLRTSTVQIIPTVCMYITYLCEDINLFMLTYIHIYCILLD